MIENRNLTPGTKLVARYHKQSYSCYVAEGEEGKLYYRLEDGRQFKSLSAAGTAITGKSCNGWAFWSLAQAETTSTPEDQEQEREIPQQEPLEDVLEDVAEARAEAADGFDPDEPIVNLDAEQPDVTKKGFFRTPNQKGLPEDQTRWYCPDCGESFLSPVNETPLSCPQGHTG